MSENKTKPTSDSVQEFLSQVSPPQRQEEGNILLNMFSDVTKNNPVLWGPNIVGFGTYHYKYASGREGDWFIVGFSPRKAALSIYGLVGYDRDETLLGYLENLGPHTTGKGCLYIKNLQKVDMSILELMMKKAWNEHVA